MKTAHLFSGAGGGLLADIILGHTPVLAVEWDRSCCNSLLDRSADGWFPELHVHCGDVREFDFTPWLNRVDCLAAGFPCQDISAAGRGEGISGARSGLVKEVFRAIDVVRPGIIWLENSPRIRTRGRHIVISELVARGYAWRDGTLAASDVGAGHERNRWWCIAANAHGMRKLQQERSIIAQWRWNSYGEETADLNRQRRNGGGWHQPETNGRPESQNGNQAPADRLRHRLQIAVQRGGLQKADAEAIQAAAGYTGTFDWSPPDTGICRMVDGVASRMDRIKAAGNGQVPLAAAAAWLILAHGINHFPLNLTTFAPRFNPSR